MKMEIVMMLNIMLCMQVKEHMSDVNSMAKLIDLVKESPLKVLMWVIIVSVILYLVLQ